MKSTVFEMVNKVLSENRASLEKSASGSGVAQKTQQLAKTASAPAPKAAAPDRAQVLISNCEKIASSCEFLADNIHMVVDSRSPKEKLAELIQLKKEFEKKAMESDPPMDPPMDSGVGPGGPQSAMEAMPATTPGGNPSQPGQQGQATEAKIPPTTPSMESPQPADASNALQTNLTDQPGAGSTTPEKIAADRRLHLAAMVKSGSVSKQAALKIIQQDNIKLAGLGSMVAGAGQALRQGARAVGGAVAAPAQTFQHLRGLQAMPQAANKGVGSALLETARRHPVHAAGAAAALGGGAAGAAGAAALGGGQPKTASTGGDLRMMAGRGLQGAGAGMIGGGMGAMAGDAVGGQPTASAVGGGLGGLAGGLAGHRLLGGGLGIGAGAALGGTLGGLAAGKMMPQQAQGALAGGGQPKTASMLMGAMGAGPGHRMEGAGAGFVEGVKNTVGGMTMGGMGGAALGAGASLLSRGHIPMGEAAAVGGSLGMGLGAVGGSVRGAIQAHERGMGIRNAHQQMQDPAKMAAAKQKIASSGLDPKLASALISKFAEDAENPAQISAGTTPELETAPGVPEVQSQGSEAGERVPSTMGSDPGRNLIASNEAAINATPRDAKNVRSEMSKWLSEPAMSAAHDKTLEQTLDNTSSAGVKIASVREQLQKWAAASPENKQKLASVMRKIAEDEMGMGGAPGMDASMPMEAPPVDPAAMMPGGDEPPMMGGEAGVSEAALMAAAEGVTVEELQLAEAMLMSEMGQGMPAMGTSETEAASPMPSDPASDAGPPKSDKPKGDSAPPAEKEEDSEKEPPAA